MNIQRIDPEHVYRDLDDPGGAPWPSVTTVLGANLGWAGSFDRIPPIVLERKRQLGTAVHLVCELDDQGAQFEPESLVDVQPYLDAWRAFKRETGWITVAAEKTVWHPGQRYAGTLDRIGRRGASGSLELVDLKTSSPAGAALKVGPQTAAYLAAWLECDPQAKGLDFWQVPRASVHLGDDGRYSVVPHDAREDWGDFLAALRLYTRSQRRR